MRTNPVKYYEYMNICRTHGLFTCGTTEQYESLAYLYSKVHTKVSLDYCCLIYGTWLCSDHGKFDFDAIVNIFDSYIEEE